MCCPNRMPHFWDHPEPEQKWRNPSPPAHHSSTPNGPLSTAPSDATPASANTTGAYVSPYVSDTQLLAALSRPASGGGGGGAGCDSSTPLQRVVDSAQRADSLRLVELAQRLGILLKYAEPPERGQPTKKWQLYEYEGVANVFLLCS
jgi:hypothetical protein